jgi:hypothetical protein
VNEDLSTPDEGREPSDEEVMAEGAKALQTLLESQPATEEELVSVLSRRLTDQITPDTWGAISHSLASYLGQSGFNVLAWGLVSEPGDQSRLEALEDAGGPDVANLARRLTAEFGDELRYAFEIWGNLADNWRLLNREVFFDLINHRHFIRIQVEKYGGEKMSFEGPPDSILSFATFLIGALRFTADPHAFSEQRIEEFTQEIGPFADMLEARHAEAVTGDRDIATAGTDLAGGMPPA